MGFLFEEEISPSAMVHASGVIEAMIKVFSAKLPAAEIPGKPWGFKLTIRGLSDKK